MKLFVLMLLLIPSVLAIDVPLFLSVDDASVLVTAQQVVEDSLSAESLPEIQELPVTGAVAYADSSANKNWALWLILGVAGVIAAILVLRR